VIGARFCAYLFPWRCFAKLQSGEHFPNRLFFRMEYCGVIVMLACPAIFASTNTSPLAAFLSQVPTLNRTDVLTPTSSKTGAPTQWLPHTYSIPPH
jgi:hypothetical protein